MARNAAREIAKDPNRTVIVTRRVQDWGISEGPNVVNYSGGQTRGASLGPNSAGGRAILFAFGVHRTRRSRTLHEQKCPTFRFSPAKWDTFGPQHLDLTGVLVCSGARGRNRTTDTAIFSRMLYQLSYPGAVRRVGFGGPTGEARAL